jgi:hypothetical protein
VAWNATTGENLLFNYKLVKVQKNMKKLELKVGNAVK